jgi:hypothetical protein
MVKSLESKTRSGTFEAPATGVCLPLSEPATRESSI